MDDAALEVIPYKNGNYLEIVNRFILKQHGDGTISAIGILVDYDTDEIRGLTDEEMTKALGLGIVVYKGSDESIDQFEETVNEWQSPKEDENEKYWTAWVERCKDAGVDPYINN